jgi:hypothetical protein
MRASLLCFLDWKEKVGRRIRVEGIVVKSC